jgi:hypothetical protein
MRLIFPVILIILAFGWILYKGLVKKNWKDAVDILRITLFFAGIWLIMYFVIFK